MDLDEASSEIQTTELQLQNCDEISLEKQDAFKGKLISEWLFYLNFSRKPKQKFDKFLS